MSRKSQLSSAAKHRLDVLLHKTTEEHYKECLEHLKAMDIPKDWQAKVYTVTGSSLPESRKVGMKTGKGQLKVYLEDWLWLTDKGLFRRVIETFAKDRRIGLIGLLGTNEVPTSGIAQNSWKLLGEKKLKDGTLKGEAVKETTDCLAVDGAFMALREDADWHEEYSDGCFYDTALTLDLRRKGQRTVLISQDTPALWQDERHRNTTEAAQKRFLDEYSKDLYPLVSVIIPTYCRPDYFKEALDSALNQTYRNLEVFITDNSPDSRTAELIKEHYAADSRVKYEHHPEYNSAKENWHTARAYNNEKAEYVQWLMDDDILLPHKLATMVDCYRQNPGVTLVTSYRRLIDKDGKPLPDSGLNKSIVEVDSRLKGSVIGREILTKIFNFIGEPTTVLIKKEYLHNNYLGWTGEEGDNAVSDFPTWLNLCEQGDVIYLREPASLFRLHGGNEQNSFVSIFSGLICWAMMIAHAWKKKVFLDKPEYLHAAAVRWMQEAVRIMGAAEKSGSRTIWDIRFREYYCRMAELMLEARKGMEENTDEK